MKLREEENRQRFNTERINTKQTIKQNIMKQINQKHSVGEEIKMQKIRIQQSIEASKKKAEEDKRARFNSHREHVNQAVTLRMTAKGEFFGMTTQQYCGKIDQARQEASEFE